MRMLLDIEDLGRLTFSTAVNPFSETLISSQTLRAAGRSYAAAPSLVHHLIPARGPIPDFLTPVTATASIEEAVDGVRSTPRAVITADVAATYREMPMTPLRRALADADPAVVDALVRSTVTMFQREFESAWPLLTTVVQLDVAHRTRLMTASGLAGVLNSLHPAIRWQPPVLAVRTGPDRADPPPEVRLGGRGLTFAPWPMAGPLPRVLIAGDRPAFVMYPVASAAVATPGNRALEKLIGRTRAAALRHLATLGPHSTGELARRLDVSDASVSEHAGALRDAGLVATVRDGRFVRHAVTPLGAALLRTATTGS